MQWFICLLAVIIRLAPSYSYATQCDQFSFGQLCSLSPISSIIDLVPGLEDEQQCQDQCVLSSDCNYFTFVKFANTSTDCFLLRDCQNKTFCAETLDCAFAIAGPKSPPVKEACCEGFGGTTCEKEAEIDHFYGVNEAAECQDLCQDTSGCNFWSLHGDICILYSQCGAPQPCSSCSSGPVFPDISSCSPEEEIFDTLVIGGGMFNGSNQDFRSLQFISGQGPWCTPNLEELPRGRDDAAGLLLGSDILICGGSIADGDPDQKSCLGLDLNDEKRQWRFVAYMIYQRSRFGLASVGGDTLYATGGEHHYFLDSTEVFTYETGWRLEERMKMNGTRSGHCSVAFGSWLYIIGGSLENQSTYSVEAFDTSSLLEGNTPGQWITKSDTLYERDHPGCQVASLEGELGIYAGGGVGRDDLWKTVEFYSVAKDSWRAIGNLREGRSWFAMSLLGHEVLVSGGLGWDGDEIDLSSVEWFNGTSWIPWYGLDETRSGHIAVSVPSGRIFCGEEKEERNPHGLL